MSKSLKLPDGMKLPKKYERSVASQQRFIEGAQDGAAGRAFAYYAEKESLRHNSRAQYLAYVEGYNAGIAAKGPS
jgi:hypothetical protein